MSGRLVRTATQGDTQRIADIYNQGIEDRTATFETSLRSEEAISDWLVSGHTVVVACEFGQVMSFAAAFPYRSRPCYAGVREFSVYVAREARGKGFGRTSMEALINETRQQGWWKLLSRVFPENTGSRRLLAGLGFREVGIYQKHAQLDGVWRDVVIVEKLLI